MERAKIGPVAIVELDNGTEKRKATVTVTVALSRLVVDWIPEPIPYDYIVTSSSGFRSTLPACCLDLCLSGELTPCTCKGQRSHGSVDRWLAHARTRCHGWHDEKVIDFAKSVLRTYSAKPGVLRHGGCSRGSYQPRDYKPCPSWPIERAQGHPGVAFVDGRQRPLDYGFDIHSRVK